MPPPVSPTPTGEEPEAVAPPAPKFKDNDFLEKAAQMPPRDPEGAECLHRELMITKEEV